MNHTDQLCQRRDAILEELGAISSLRKGCLCEQWFPVVRDKKKTSELRGPYYVWSLKEGGKTLSERLSIQPDIEQARLDASNYARFRKLCHELEEVLAALGLARREGDELVEAVKKKPSLRSRTMRK